MASKVSRTIFGNVKFPSSDKSASLEFREAAQLITTKSKFSTLARFVVLNVSPSVQLGFRRVKRLKLLEREEWEIRTSKSDKCSDLSIFSIELPRKPVEPNKSRLLLFGTCSIPYQLFATH